MIPAFARHGGLDASVRALFSAGEKGVWYDPSSWATTCYQDTAGTTLCTAMEQPVGKILDRSGNGFHATASADANRPTLSARVNLLTKTEQFNDAAWTLRNGNGAITANATTDPLGGSAADKVGASGNITESVVGVWQQITKAAAAIQYTATFYAKKGEVQYVEPGLACNGGLIGVFARFNLDTGAKYVDVTGFGGGLSNASASIVDAGNGWWRITLSALSDTSTDIRLNCYFHKASDGSSTSYTSGDGAYLWGADLRVANESLTAPAYQRVNTSTDYDTVGFPVYLAFNGTSSHMTLTNSVLSAFGGENFALSMFSAVRRNTTNYAVVFGLADNTSATASQNDALALDLTQATTQARGWIRDYGDVITDKVASAGTVSAPETFVASWARSTTTGIARINGVDGAAADQTQPALSLPLGTIGARRRGSAPIDGYLDGRIYSLIVRGAASSAAQIALAETYCNVRAGKVY